VTGTGWLSIGQFARATGLTAKALRHYDSVGLLAPAAVDPDNGYRRYAAEQVPVGRLVRRLRDLELPLDEVKRLLGYGEGPALDAALQSHRKRLEARTTRLRRQLHDLDHLLADGRTAMTAKTDPGLDDATHRQVGVALFNHVWTLLENEQRTAEQDIEMVHAAHASAYHWMQVGTAANRARSEWQCSRVYAVLRRPEPALWHARLVLEICEREGIGDWDLAFAYEALARAHAVAGDADEAARWLEQARNAAAAVAEDDDRELVLADLETIPLPR
jgi:DNA-binding transcriptional MerR regulator